ncbi:uncharacterized protein (DUF305 family) [Leifsonia sp. AK011]|uniref:DUF305 domain-containing protein n=1 Tax=Leifsonia sp. AK011 TaxID=2723075 RepID=UPI0015CE4052|nr:DUF305 domain-containing protein [Leifsonia sp. AK011]NYF09142.1 uncharacterized protein (DUF305 family) [Leifsonia sp. AK011]
MTETDTPVAGPSRRSVVSLVAAIVAVAVCVIVAGFAWGASLGSAQGSSVDAKAPASVFPNSADFCYAQMMMPHHQQAVDMSAILLAKEGVSERARKFAEFVQSDQSREITSVEAWTEAWRTEYRSNPPVQTIDDPVTSHGHEPGSELATGGFATEVDVDELVDCGDASDPGRFVAMAGMLTPTQLDELRGATAHDAEILYLQLMIPHHEGALDMSREVVLGGVNHFTIQMARHILNEQQIEIEAMTRMIEEMS